MSPFPELLATWARLTAGTIGPVLGGAMNPQDGQHSRCTEAPVSWSSHHSRRALAVGGALTLAAAAIVAFLVAPGPLSAGPSGTPPPRVIPNPSVLPPPANPPPRSPDRAALENDFAQLQTRLHSKIGVVLRPVGTGSKGPITFGDWSSGPAWSTIKVPLVIAAMRQQSSRQVTEPMTAAITKSDNAAAESLWEGLGDPATAAAKVEEVLRSTGDLTAVQSQKVRPEYTAFGQTDWSLSDQVLFLSAAACDPNNAPTMALMAEVDDDQRWGLGTLADTKIKGGWGPSPSGRYLVRQIAIVWTPNGQAAVAIAAEPESGSFADGTHDLTEIARWLQAHLDVLPGAQCSP
jgi:hypothetical protein